MAIASEQAPQSRSGKRGDTPAVAAVPEELRREFEDLGLSPYEARLLLAMLQLGPATTLELAHVSGVPRTSTYPVLEGLQAKQLAHRVPGEGPAIWASVGRDDILTRLDAAEQERLRQHRARAERVRTMLAASLPEDSPTVQPPLRLLHTAAEQQAAYQRLASQAQAEALVFVRPPYPARPGQLEPMLADLAGRIETRVLYAAEPAGGSGSSPSIAAMQACRAAGAYARVVDELPMQLAVFDRQVALVALDGLPPLQEGFATLALIEHAGFAAVLAEGFKYRWAGGAPCGCHDA